MAQGADSDGLSRARSSVQDNQKPATSEAGFVKKAGTRGPAGVSSDSLAGQNLAGDFPGSKRRGSTSKSSSGGQRGGTTY